VFVLYIDCMAVGKWVVVKDWSGERSSYGVWKDL
jgi:hypothetical protein